MQAGCFILTAQTPWKKMQWFQYLSPLPRSETCIQISSLKAACYCNTHVIVCYCNTCLFSKMLSLLSSVACSEPPQSGLHASNRGYWPWASFCAVCVFCEWPAGRRSHRTHLQYHSHTCWQPGPRSELLTLHFIGVFHFLCYYGPAFSRTTLLLIRSCKWIEKVKSQLLEQWFSRGFYIGHHQVFDDEMSSALFMMAFTSFS